MGPQKGTAGTGDDLATLGDLDEQALLEHLNYRYRRDCIYTYIGDILVSINPYKPITGLYGVEVGKRYGRAKTLNELRPHVYAIGSRAFHNVQREQGNQCILVSGESGAGKTEITKMLVAQISRLSQWDGEHFLQDRIIEVNPLLEAFGNASTAINDNSSRFGKLIELVFTDTGSLLGARITEHMLEKSRVSRQSQGEKNFHMFYNLMCGLTEEERKRYFLEEPERYRQIFAYDITYMCGLMLEEGKSYFLEEPEKYRIIDPGHGAPVIPTDIDYQGYAESMDNLRRTMPVVGFNPEDMDVVFALLAAILHLCNIEMAVEPESDEVIVMNEDEIEYAAVLLSVNAEDLITCLLANINWVRGERLVYIKNLHQAVDGRDALAKALYSKLFSWIVHQINFMLHEDERMPGPRSVISVLDMAGFENFQYNSFEQLCINSANERLQHFFNEHIFTMELQEYQAEGVKQPKVKFTNNAELLNMLFQKPIGVFSLLEEECSLAKTTDMTLVDKLNKHCTRQELYKKSKHREPVFGISHYAGLVTYSAVSFLEKNRDTLSQNMQSLMENSKNNLVNELFSAAVLDTGTLDMRKGSGKNTWKKQVFNRPEQRQYSPGDSLSRQAGRKIRQRMKEQKSFHEIPITSNPTSASAHFKNSLHFLMDRLRGSETHFIRCIKPNTMKLAIKFDSRLVLEQLKNTGVSETVRIRRLGYPVRLPFADFIQRYKVLAYPLTSNIEPSAKNCARILKCAKVSDVPIGHSKVFLKYWHCDQLNLLMDSYTAAAVQLQSQVLMRLSRQNFIHLLKLSRRDADEVYVFGESIMSYGLSACQMLEEQYRHDSERARQSAVHNGFRDHHPQSMYINEEAAQREVSRQMRMPDVFSPGAPSPGPSKLEGSKGFYKYIIDQTLSRLPDLDSDVWCKVFYMEHERPVAKFYICDREVIIDGSNDEFTGKKIGLGVFKNAQRSEETAAIRSFIGKGIQIRRDVDGSITACRHGKNHVFAMGYRDPANHCLSADVIKNEGRLPSNQQSVKVFDMDEFKSHMGIMLRSQQYDRARLQGLSVCGLSFIQEAELDLDTPCWLCIISIPALQMVDSADAKKEIQQKFVKLSLQDESQLEEQQNLQIAAERHQRQWSKLNLKQTDNLKKEPLRKTRLQLIQQGQKVQDNMDYSWDDKNYDQANRQRNIAELQEGYDRFDENESIMPGLNVQGTPGRAQSIASSAAFTDVSQSTRKDWAKIKVTVKQDRNAVVQGTEQKPRVSQQD